MPRTPAAFQQIRDQRREQILRVAAKVFAHRGFANTKIADLAEAANMSQGLLYRYFANREEVLAALLQQATQTAIEYAQAALERPEGPADGLHWLTEALLRAMHDQPELCYCFSQVSAVPGALGDFGAALDNSLRRLILAGQAAGQITRRDPEQLVLLYLCCIQGIASGTMIYGDRMLAHFPDADSVTQIFKPTTPQEQRP